MAGGLLLNHQLTSESYQGYFWLGIHPALRTKLEIHMQWSRTRDNGPVDTPYTVQEINAAAEVVFKRNRFETMLVNAADYGVDVAGDDSDDESGQGTDSDDASDFEEYLQHKKKKRKARKSKNDKKTSASYDNSKDKLKYSGTQDEIANMIRQLNAMKTEDPEYAPIYYKVMTMDQSGMAMKSTRGCWWHWSRPEHVFKRYTVAVGLENILRQRYHNEDLIRILLNTGYLDNSYNYPTQHPFHGHDLDRYLTMPRWAVLEPMENYDATPMDISTTSIDLHEHPPLATSPTNPFLDPDTPAPAPVLPSYQDRLRESGLEQLVAAAAQLANPAPAVSNRCNCEHAQHDYNECPHQPGATGRRSSGYVGVERGRSLTRESNAEAGPSRIANRDQVPARDLRRRPRLFQRHRDEEIDDDEDEVIQSLTLDDPEHDAYNAQLRSASCSSSEY
ncbi:RT-RNaseH-2 domain-containing protein [Mycena chlorophos]|uniref:RT-RNaseH-2 domain-containing protein n=1 Tax=Mycena chlorophos TaxID=658473 RepID=A0A8H6SNY0_MYCCL|nr:RT-RNaseH-2 domain-containing protein [Mycena chlorophos]